MQIFILGSSGFIGTCLLDIFKQETAYNLQNVDKQPSKFHPELTVIANILNKEKLASLLKGTDVVILLAAEHRDDVTPFSLYYDVNVQGMRNTLEAMEANGVKRIIFTSSVAIYGLNKENPGETHPADPFNHYGKSKWQAEQILQEWYKTHLDWNINIIRPTVVFGERNRGNVYNLLKQIASGKFLMVGNGKNRKSMAYVENVAAFIKYLIEEKQPGYNIYNYADKPDFTTNDLVVQVSKVLKKRIPTVHLPLWLGMAGGYCFDALAFVTRKKFTVSSVRVKKFCATTQFDATKVQATGFKAPYTLGEGLARTLEFEFIHDASNGVTFKSE